MVPRLPVRVAPWTLAVMAAFLLGLSQCEPAATVIPPTEKPGVALLSPANNASLTLGDGVLVHAVAKDMSGIVRMDLVVDGVIVNTQPLVFASVELDYQYTWKPIVLGAHDLTILAYSARNVVSDPATIRVNVVQPPITATPRLATPSLTPYIVVITATRAATATPTWTPRVIVITATREPTPTRTQTSTATLTPYVIVVTNTPPPSATPQPTK